MIQYNIYALDFTDAGALERRMVARGAHLDGARALKAQGNFILGGAILDENGKMIGSNLILQFESEEALENWKASEPYILERVWEKVEIRPFKVAAI